MRLLRHRQIRSIIAEGEVTSQDHLQKLLKARRIRVTQATLSRDLREMGVLKGPSGYVLPGPERPETAAVQNGPRLATALRMYLASAERGGTLVVLKTGPGRAGPLAADLDGAGLRGVLGTIAGDDTVFVAAASESRASELLEEFLHLAGGEDRPRRSLATARTLRKDL